MIVVNGIVKSSPGDIDALSSAIRDMEAASRAEAGCLDYTFSVELSDPQMLRITEKWASLDALKAHFATPHMAEFQARMGAHPPASMDISFYEAEEIHPF